MKISFKRRNLHDREIDCINELIQMLEPVSLDDQVADSLLSKVENDGTFSVKVCYKSLFRKMGGVHDCWPWKIIWKSILPHLDCHS